MQLHVVLSHLAEGPIYSLADWPNAAVPKFGAGAYTVHMRAERQVRSGAWGHGVPLLNPERA